MLPGYKKAITTDEIGRRIAALPDVSDKARELRLTYGEIPGEFEQQIQEEKERQERGAKV